MDWVIAQAVVLFLEYWHALLVLQGLFLTLQSVTKVLLFLAPQTCVSCSSISYCNTCADGPTCTLCNSPYVLAPSGCNFSIKYLANQICVPCSYITGCNSCVDGPSCTACTLPYVLDTSTCIFTFNFRSSNLRYLFFSYFQLQYLHRRPFMHWLHFTLRLKHCFE